MNAQAILDKIHEDARSAAETTEAEAVSRAAEIQAASSAKIESLRNAAVSQAEKESAELEQRMLRMAVLDDRKELLLKRRNLIDETFALAMKKLYAMPNGQKRAFFAERLTGAAQGAETIIVGAECAEWYDAAFVDEMNDRLRQMGKAGNMRAAAERRVGATGLVLAAKGTEIYCTFETLLDSLRAELETEIAGILFQE